MGATDVLLICQNACREGAGIEPANDAEAIHSCPRLPVLKFCHESEGSRQ